MPELENPMLSPNETDDPIVKPIGKCHYKRCDEVVYQNDGYEFGGFIYCSTTCIGDQLFREGEVIDLSQQ